MVGKKNKRKIGYKGAMIKNEKNIQNNDVSSTSATSVGITTYNAANFIAACIKMILLWKQFSITPCPKSRGDKKETKISEKKVQTWFRCKRNALNISWYRESFDKWNQAGKCKCFSCKKLYNTA